MYTQLVLRVAERFCQVGGGPMYVACPHSDL